MNLTGMVSGAFALLNSKRPESPGGEARAAPRAGRAAWRDYVELTKPRVIALLLLTTLVAMWMAGGGKLTVSVLAWTLLGGYLSAGGAEAINCYLDRDVDACMDRTSRRAVPSGRLKPRRALMFGIFLSVTSFFILLRGTNVLAAVLSLAGLLHYVLIYTWWLKRRTVHNVVIGGIAGGMPPLVGWAAATGQLAPMAWLLSAIVIAWSPAHFWALALLKKREYARAGIPMLPVVYGESRTRRAIFAWTLVTVSMSFLPLAGLANNIAARAPFYFAYGLSASALGAIFLYGAQRIIRTREREAAKKFYLSTIFYLGMIFLCMALLPNG